MDDVRDPVRDLVAPVADALNNGLGFLRQRPAIAVSQGVDVAFDGGKRGFEFMRGENRGLGLLLVNFDQHLIGIFELMLSQLQARADFAYQVPAEKKDTAAGKHESERDSEARIHHRLELAVKNAAHRDDAGPFQYQRQRRARSRRRLR